MRRLCLLALLATASPAAAQAPGEPIRMTIHPAPLPSPALQYQLLPQAADWMSGNAVVHYYRAFAPEWNGWRHQPEIFERISDALHTPLKDLPRRAPAQPRRPSVPGTPLDFDWLLDSQQLREVDLAARHTYADWEFLERMKKEGIGMLLPDVQGFREFANLLALRARLELAHRQYDKAAYSLQTGFTLGRHVADAPLVINALVGVAIAEVQVGQVEEWVQTAGSPNLYWALTGLPRPFIDLRKPLQGDQLLLYAELPSWFRNIDKTVLSAQQQQALVDALVGMMQFPHGRRSGPGERLGLMALVLKGYPEARQALLARGRKAGEIEAMPMVQVYSIHALQQFRRIQDDILKWCSLPYPEGQAGLARTDQQIREAHRRLEGEPFLSLLPTHEKLYLAPARLDRKIAALRCIEAIRCHAATHDGRLPARLAQITDLPIPPDPLTGKPFTYEQAGNKATLAVERSRPDAERSPDDVAYELTLER